MADYLQYPAYWPIKGGSGIITSPFGRRTNPVTQKEEQHNAIDIGRLSGLEQIVAPVKMVIHTLGIADPHWGNYLEGLFHFEGCPYILLFAHIRDNYQGKFTPVNVGDEVIAGADICKVGQSGRVTGPCLHFGLQHVETKKWIDPTKAFEFQYLY